MKYLNFKPSLGEGVYISPGAFVIGRATLHEHVNVWFNSVIRADVNEIIIGHSTNIQDLSVLHVTEKNGLYIGEHTSLGHHVVLHGCEVGKGCLIGMGAIILDGAKIGDYSLVAAGSLVPPGKTYPPYSLIKGSPAKLERALSEAEIEQVSNHYKSYLVYKEQYLNPQN